MTNQTLSGVLTLNPSSYRVGVNIENPLSTVHAVDNGETSIFETPAFNFLQQEKFQAGSGFHHGFVMQLARTGGTGHREAMAVNMLSSGAAVGEMLVGIHPMGVIQSGSGSAFGSNPYVWIAAGVSTTAEAVGEEINTDIRNTSVIRKVGLQIIDVSTSTGGGTMLDSAIVIGMQAGARGYSNGIQFGIGVGGCMQSAGNLIAAPYPFTTTNGVDFSQINFTGSVFKSAGFNLNPIGDLSSRTLMLSTPAVATTAGRVAFGSGTSLTVGLAGAAPAPPAAPLGYLIAFIGGTGVKIPYYNG